MLDKNTLKNPISWLKSGHFSLALYALLATIILDLTLSYSTTITSASSYWEVVVFMLISATYVGGLYFILYFLQNESIDLRKNVTLMNKLTKIVILVQSTLAAFVVVMIFQVLWTSHYSTITLVWGSSVSYAMAALAIGVLSQRFIAWYKSIRNYVVLLYGLSCAALAINLVVLGTFTAVALYTEPNQRSAKSSPSPLQFYDESKPLGKLQYYSAVADFVPPFLLWVSTAIMLRNYSKVIGTWIFWILMSIPIIFFVVQPILIAPLIVGISNPHTPLYITTAGTILPGIIGGILFGIPFFAVASRLHENRKLKTYLIVSGWGLILLNITLSADIMNAPYLPFGFATTLCTSLASYLVLIGLYSSAISIASDSDLRRTIKTTVIGESKLLGSIGSAQEMDAISNRVMDMTKKRQSSIMSESGVESSLTDEEIERYMEEVIKEVQDRIHKPK